MRGQGVKHLVLTGRRGIDTAGASEAVSELEGLGSKVTVAALDVADRDSMAALLASLPADLPLRGVVHSAGVLDDGVLQAQSAERFRRVMSPKVMGASHLDALTRKADLDFFVMFSSATGTFGTGGQGSYAAANVFLDALASHRQALGLVGQSLAWGLWTDSAGAPAGMAIRMDDTQCATFIRRGFKPLSPVGGITLLDAVLGRAEAQLVLVPIDPSVAKVAFGNSVPPIWRTLVKVPGETERARRGRGPRSFRR